MKQKIIYVLVILIILVGAYFLLQSYSQDTNISDNQEPIETSTSTDDNTDVTIPEGEDPEDENELETVIGTSAGGYDITAYHYGEGNNELLFIGGFHGGYEWNTVLVAYELMDYLENDLSILSDNLKVTVIPVLNPDGLNEVVGTTDKFSVADVPSSQSATIPGRFNANNVDLNRNFDCDWQSTATWQNREVDGGDQVFSEPESQALRDYIRSSNPEAVVVWYSAADGVFASSCHNGVLEETTAITNVYADASGYPAYESYNFYEVTGDAVNWLAKEGVPAISVLLSNHQDIEWDKNKAGIDALLEWYSM